MKTKNKKRESVYLGGCLVWGESFIWRTLCNDMEMIMKNRNWREVAVMQREKFLWKCVVCSIRDGAYGDIHWIWSH